MSISQKVVPEASHVLAKATLETADFLGLSSEALGYVLGRDRSSITRLKKLPSIDPNSKTGELALLLIRVYRGLFAILGGNQAAMRAWMKQNNRALSTPPQQAIQTVIGLASTVQYIDAMRGKI